MITVTFNFPLMPKPRGKIGKGGNIYHNSKEYVTFKNDVWLAVKEQLGYVPTIEHRIYVGLFSEYKRTNRGRSPDFLDNQLGGLLDALVQLGLLKDDSRKELFGDKKMSHPGIQEKNILILGRPMMIDIKAIDEEITKQFLLTQLRT